MCRKNAEFAHVAKLFVYAYFAQLVFQSLDRGSDYSIDMNSISEVVDNSVPIIDPCCKSDFGSTLEAVISSSIYTVSMIIDRYERVKLFL